MSIPSTGSATTNSVGDVLPVCNGGYDATQAVDIRQTQGAAAVASDANVDPAFSETVA